MKLKNLKEAKYSNQAAYIVQVFDPEDGIIQSYGPFPDKDTAKKFGRAAETYVHKLFREMDVPKNYVDDLPAFIVEEIASPNDVFENVKRDMESMFG